MDKSKYIHFGIRKPSLLESHKIIYIFTTALKITNIPIVYGIVQF